MIQVAFADTLYWIATVKPGDQWSESAKKAKSSLGKVRLVTTDEVLIEFLNLLAKGGDSLRKSAVEMVKAILQNANITVIPQTRATFLNGMDFYSLRPDKGYSLTDCISMQVMKSEEISDILTNDYHFTQEGFNRLMQ